jgi:hypothetical protein
MWDTSVIFKELNKVNNHPLGENWAKYGHPDRVRF